MSTRLTDWTLWRPVRVFVAEVMAVRREHSVTADRVFSALEARTLSAQGFQTLGGPFEPCDQQRGRLFALKVSVRRHRKLCHVQVTANFWVSDLYERDYLALCF